MRILVVEDDRDLREAYAEYLRDEGYDVDVAENGLRALEVARSRQPDLVFMDLALPVLDGWEATRVLKRDAKTKTIPVVAITGHALKAREADARSAGCDAVLRKPCAPQLLVETIRKIAPSSDCL